MKQFQPEQVRKIWQRVQSGAAYQPTSAPVSMEDSKATMRGLILRELEIKSCLIQLSGMFSGKNAAVLRQLARQTQSHAAILRGICAISEGNTPPLRSGKPAAASTGALLRRCYGQILQSLSEYESRSLDPRFGSTFQKLTEQKNHHCRILLALLGSL